MLPHGSAESATTSEQEVVKRKARLQEKQYQRITGRHIFLQDAMRKMSVANEQRGGPAGKGHNVSNETIADHVGQAKRPLSTKKVLALHGEYWAKLTPAEKEPYNVRARAERNTRELARVEKMQSLETAAEIKRVQADAHEANDSMTISACRLHRHELGDLCDIVSARRTSKAGLPKKDVCPKPLDSHTMEQMVKASLLDKLHGKPSTELLLRMSRARDRLSGAVICIHGETGCVYYRFLWALQQPCELMLLPVIPEELPVDLTESTMAAWKRSALSEWTQGFRSAGF